MNVENILKVADAIEKHSIPDLGFNMLLYGARLHSYLSDQPDHSGHNCRTVACVAGWTAAVGGFRTPKTLRDEDGHQINEFARDFLGLDEGEATELFVPNCNLPSVTTAQAIHTLRCLAATGKVQWDLSEIA